MAAYRRFRHANRSAVRALDAAQGCLSLTGPAFAMPTPQPEGVEPTRSPEPTM